MADADPTDEGVDSPDDEALLADGSYQVDDRVAQRSHYDCAASA